MEELKAFKAHTSPPVTKTSSQSAYGQGYPPANNTTKQEPTGIGLLASPVPYIFPVSFLQLLGEQSIASGVLRAISKKAHHWAITCASCPWNIGFQSTVHSQILRRTVFTSRQTWFLNTKSFLVSQIPYSIPPEIL